MTENKRNFLSTMKSIYKKRMTNTLHGAILNAFALKLRQGKITSPKFKMTLTTFIQY